MSNVMNDLHTIGLNPFAVVLLAESLLKSPLAPMTVGKPQGLFMPINRGDCPGWAGVRITVEAVPSAESVERERDALRAAQTAAVMPLIGPLLDAWENADRELMDEEPELVKQLKAIQQAMEDA